MSEETDKNDLLIESASFLFINNTLGFFAAFSNEHSSSLYVSNVSRVQRHLKEGKGRGLQVVSVNICELKKKNIPDCRLIDEKKGGSSGVLMSDNSH